MLRSCGDVVPIPYVPVVCGYPSNSSLLQARQLFFAQEPFHSFELSTWLLGVVCNHTYPVAGNVLINARFEQSPEISGRGILFLSD